MFEPFQAPIRPARTARDPHPRRPRRMLGSWIVLRGMAVLLTRRRHRRLPRLVLWTDGLGFAAPELGAFVAAIVFTAGTALLGCSRETASATASSPWSLSAASRPAVILASDVLRLRRQRRDASVRQPLLVDGRDIALCRPRGGGDARRLGGWSAALASPRVSIPSNPVAADAPPGVAARRRPVG